MKEKDIHEDYIKEWYKQCEKCKWYYVWEHECSWVMAMLVAAAKSNWKIIKFVDCTPDVENKASE